MEHTGKKPLDRRQRKTRDAIHTALMALMSEKPLDAITITELAQRANVNRKTFYNHYTSIQDVRRELDEQYIDMIFSFTESEDLDKLSLDPSPFIHQLVQAIVKQPVRARLLFESGEHLYLAERLKAMFLPYMEQIAAARGNKAEYVPYVLNYTVNGTLALLNLWVHDTNQLPPEVFSQMVSKLVQSCAQIEDCL